MVKVKGLEAGATYLEAKCLEAGAGAEVSGNVTCVEELGDNVKVSEDNKDMLQTKLYEFVIECRQRILWDLRFRFFIIWDLRSGNSQL